ncbi:hypothetical protein ABT095_35295 [Kitasatospora sp. NPDC002227]|uniref:dTMP kinase n=1 Tax=Kitasatospora sp. NPDC002227 TaxID=3154773 RepID=UPI0033256E42
MLTEVRFQPQPGPGKLIAFEGVDGAGKSTTIEVVAGLLEAAGVPFERVDLLSPQARRLPYFRRHAQDPTTARRGEGDQPALGIVCLGDRLGNFRTVHHARLAAGTWLLVDRYVFTPLAEAQALGSGPEDVALLTRLAGMFPRPDAAFFPTVPAELAIERIRSRPKDRGKVLDEEFYRRAVSAFAQYSRHGSLALDTTAGPEAVRRTVRPCLHRLIHEYHGQLGQS